MATKARSQSTTPKPPAAALASPPLLSSNSSSISTLSASTLPPIQQRPFQPQLEQQPQPITFNTNMFVASAPQPIGLREPGMLPMPSPYEPSDHASPAAPPLYGSMITHPTTSDYYGSNAQVTIPNFYPSSTPTARSMSIQSLVSTASTANNSSLDDDSISVVSHTTTRNTDDDDGDISVEDIDDPDVRMAAEALGDLRADFVSSPNSASSSVGGTPRRQKEDRQETMFEMIQGQNTFLGSAVRAGRYVYRGGKRYSPRFKYGAEMVESAAAPMASVVSFAARTTGVEAVIRRNLESRRLSTSSSSQTHTSSSSSTQSPASSTSQSHATKRRKTALNDVSMDVDSTSSPTTEEPLTHKPATDVVALNWQRRLMLSTAGVGVALSEESLRSLKYCLAWLRWANDHLDKVIIALRGVLAEWDSEQKAVQERSGTDAIQTTSGNTIEMDERSKILQENIEKLRKDVIGTLKSVVEVVSRYAGGALPENARVVVKACITNLPRRWAMAAKDTGPENSMAVVVRKEEEAGKRVLVLAKEGLEMLHQVSSIVQATLDKAEEWCDTLGRKKPEDGGEYGKVGWEMEGIEERIEENPKTK